MNLKTKHAQAIRELVTATTAGDETTVRDIVLDGDICLHEAIFIVAMASGREQVSVNALADQISASSRGLVGLREQMAKRIQNGGMDGVVKELASRDRPNACCLVALVIDWLPRTAESFAHMMEHLHENPELMSI